MPGLRWTVQDSHRGTSVDTDNELALLKAKTEILGGF